MANYVEGEGEPPPELTFHLMVKAWGDPDGRGWGQWPARWFRRVRLARAVYQAWDGYIRAENRAKHPDPSGMVGLVKQYRYEDGEEEADRVQVWEGWIGIDPDG